MVYQWNLESYEWPHESLLHSVVHLLESQLHL